MWRVGRENESAKKKTLMINEKRLERGCIINDLLGVWEGRIKFECVSRKNNNVLLERAGCLVRLKTEFSVHEAAGFLPEEADFSLRC